MCKGQRSGIKDKDTPHSEDEHLHVEAMTHGQGVTKQVVVLWNLQEGVRLFHALSVFFTLKLLLSLSQILSFVRNIFNSFSCLYQTLSAGRFPDLLQLGFTYKTSSKTERGGGLLLVSASWEPDAPAGGQTRDCLRFSSRTFN